MLLISRARRPRLLGAACCPGPPLLRSVLLVALHKPFPTLHHDRPVHGQRADVLLRNAAKMHRQPAGDSAAVDRPRGPVLGQSLIVICAQHAWVLRTSAPHADCQTRCRILTERNDALTIGTKHSRGTKFDQPGLNWASNSA